MFEYEVVKHIATLSSKDDGKQVKEVNMISYNGADPKLDIRIWNRQTGRMMKGIALNREETQALKECLANL